MKNKEIAELREKILKGIALSAERLIQLKQKTNGELVFSKDGEIVFIKASDLIKGISKNSTIHINQRNQI